MKSISTIVAITLFGLLPVAFVHGQGSPKPAAGEKSAAPAGAGKRTDVYHVHFTKAALGKAVQLGDWLKTPDRSNPMPDHFIVLRHRDGDAWDYVASWEEFTRAMGIDADSKSKTTGSAYSVSYYRPAPGHREQLEKMLSQPVGGRGDTTAGNVLMQHLEGAAWTFLTIARYNSWEDFATGEKNSIATTTNKDSPWYQLREHAAFHTDTLTDRIAP